MFNLKTDTIIILQIFVILLLILLIKDKVEGYKVEGFDDTTQVPPAFIQFIKGVDPDIKNNTVILSLNTNDLNNETYTFTKDGITKNITGNFFNYEILKKIKPSFNANDINKIEVTSNSNSNYHIIFYKGRNFDGNSYSRLISKSDIINISDTSSTEPNDLPFHPFSFKIFNDPNNMNEELQREANNYNQILLFNNNGYNGEIIRLPVKLTPDGTTIAIDSFTSTNKIIKSIKFPGDNNDNDNDNNDFRNIELKFIKLLNEEEEEEEANELPIIKQSKDNLTIDIDKLYYKITPQVATLETTLAQNIIDENKTQLFDLKDDIQTEINNYVKNNSKITDNQNNFMKNMSNNITDSMKNEIDRFQFDLSNYKFLNSV